MSRLAFPDFVPPRQCSDCGEYEDAETELRYVGTLPVVLVCEHCAFIEQSEHSCSGCGFCLEMRGMCV